MKEITWESEIDKISSISFLGHFKVFHNFPTKLYVTCLDMCIIFLGSSSTAFIVFRGNGVAKTLSHCFSHSWPFKVPEHPCFFVPLLFWISLVLLALQAPTNPYSVFKAHVKWHLTLLLSTTMSPLIYYLLIHFPSSTSIRALSTLHLTLIIC